MRTNRHFSIVVIVVIFAVLCSFWEPAYSQAGTIDNSFSIDVPALPGNLNVPAGVSRVEDIELINDNGETAVILGSYGLLTTSNRNVLIKADLSGQIDENFANSIDDTWGWQRVYSLTVDDVEERIFVGGEISFNITGTPVGLGVIDYDGNHVLFPGPGNTNVPFDVSGWTLGNRPAVLDILFDPETQVVYVVCQMVTAPVQTVLVALSVHSQTTMPTSILGSVVLDNSSPMSATAFGGLAFSEINGEVNNELLTVGYANSSPLPDRLRRFSVDVTFSGGIPTAVSFVPDPNFSAPSFGPAGTSNPFSVKGINDIAYTANGDILVVGSFNQVNGLNQENVARLDQFGAHISSFNIDFPNNTFLNDLLIDGCDRILLCGNFSSINQNTDYNFIARFSDSGALDASFSSDILINGSEEVRDARLLPDGRIVIGTTWNETDFDYAAVLRTDEMSPLFSSCISWNGSAFEVSASEEIVLPDEAINSWTMFDLTSCDDVTGPVVYDGNSGPQGLEINVGNYYLLRHEVQLCGASCVQGLLFSMSDMSCSSDVNGFVEPRAASEVPPSESEKHPNTENSAFLIKQNEAHEYIEVSFPLFNDSGVHFEVYDTHGKIVWKDLSARGHNSAIIRYSEFAPGVYTILATSGTEYRVHRFVVR